MNEVEINLIHKLVAGDRQAFEIIYNKYYPILTAVAYRILGNDDDARDVTQRLFSDLWSDRAAFEIVHTTIEGWLKVNIKNRSLKHLDKNKRILEADEEYMRPLDASTFMDGESDPRWSIVQDAINQLSPRRQEIFTLHKIDKLSHAEIAEKLNVSVKTVKNTMVQASKELNQILKSTGKLPI